TLASGFLSRKRYFHVRIGCKAIVETLLSSKPTIRFLFPRLFQGGAKNSAAPRDDSLQRCREHAAPPSLRAESRNTLVRLHRHTGRRGLESPPLEDIPSGD